MNPNHITIFVYKDPIVGGILRKQKLLSAHEDRIPQVFRGLKSPPGCTHITVILMDGVRLDPRIAHALRINPVIVTIIDVHAFDFLAPGPLIPAP